MEQENALIDLKNILSDSKGKYWNQHFEEFKRISSILSLNLNEEKFNQYLKYVGRLKRDEGAVYYQFGYALLSLTLKPHSKETWTENAYKGLVEIISDSNSEKYSDIVLVGNRIWPGIISGFPKDDEANYLKKLYEIVSARNFGDENNKATILASILTNFESFDNDWFEGYLNQLIVISSSLKKEANQAEALSGIVYGFSNAINNHIVKKVIEDLIDKARELSEYTDNSFIQSPRVKLLDSIISSISYSEDNDWMKTNLKRVWSVLKEMSNESESSAVYISIALLYMKINSKKKLSRTLECISKFKDNEVLSETIGKLSDELVESDEIGNYGPFFDKLIDLAMNIKPDEYKAKALGYSVYSIGLALAKLYEHTWAKNRLDSFISYFKLFKDNEVKGEYLGYLTENLKEINDNVYVTNQCNQIIAYAETIENVEYRSDAYMNIAKGLSVHNGGGYIQEYFRELIRLSKLIDDDEFRISAIYGSHGILTSSFGFDTLPDWAIPLFKELSLELSEYDNSFDKAYYLSDFAEKMLPLLPQEEIDPFLSILYGYILNEDDPENLYNAIQGIAKGVSKIENETLRKKKFFEILNIPKEFDEDKAIGFAISSILKGAFGLFSKLREAPWRKNVFIHLLDICNTSINDETIKSIVIFGGKMEIDPSIIQVLDDVADETWFDFYLTCFNTILSFDDFESRNYSWVKFIDYGIGFETVNENLTKSDWLKDMTLSVLYEYITDYSNHLNKLEDEELESCISDVARTLDLLERRIELQRKNNKPVFRDQRKLYFNLIEVLDKIPEETFTELDPYTKDIDFELSPRTTLFSLIAKDFMLSEDESWTREYLDKIIHSLESITNPSNKKEVISSIIDGVIKLDSIENQTIILEKLIALTNPNDASDKYLVLALMRSFIRLEDYDEAVKIAHSFEDPIIKVQALREISAVIDTEFPEEAQLTLKELKSLDSKDAITKGLLRNPDYKDNNPSEYEFDIAISFAGPDRQHASSISKACEEVGLKVFYDKNYQADLWGEDLIKKLFSIYSSKALYCLVLISKNYTERKWTMHELEAAQSRQLESKEAYILPIRIDDTDLPGYSTTSRGFASLKEYTYVDIANMLVKRVLKKRSQFY